MLRVELCRQAVCDADLASLFRHLEMRLQTAERQLACALDLSDNPDITDHGVETYLIPFLKNWPRCHSLKLCRTCVSGKSLGLLTEWLSNSQVFEVDLSQVSGPITNSVVYEALQAIVIGRRTTYTDKANVNVKLWLYLELNDIKGAVDVGPHINIWERSNQGWKRPTTCKANKIPFVELVLYPAKVETSCNRGTELLSILRAKPAAKNDISEPLALSADEFKLWCMESREAAEVHADSKNFETFGQDACAAGWTFEKNVEANRNLSQSRLLEMQVEASKTLAGSPIDAVSHKDAAGAMVDKTVRSILRESKVLRVSDFKGNVREWMMAIYRVAGGRGVLQAAELIKGTVEGKKREDVTKWAGYLSKLLERFHATRRPTVQLQ